MVSSRLMYYTQWCCKMFLLVRNVHCRWPRGTFSLCILSSLKSENCHNTNFVVTLCTAGCRNDNLRYRQWRLILLYENSISVISWAPWKKSCRTADAIVVYVLSPRYGMDLKDTKHLSRTCHKYPCFCILPLEFGGIFDIHKHRNGRVLC